MSSCSYQNANSDQRTGANADRYPFLRPLKPHDALAFEELARRYNFELTSERRAVFTRLLLDEFRNRPSPVRVLDIGCGRGMGREVSYVHAIREHVDELWGIEPDRSVAAEEGVFDRFQHALMEEASLPEGYFDVMYSYMVMEHVPEPERFMRAVMRALRPGGAYYFVTPNAAHYFARTASALKRLRLDDAVLRIIQGRKLVGDYHYPVQYRFNSPGVIRRIATSVGASETEIVFLEHEGPKPYMKGPLLPVFHILRLKRRVIRNPCCLLTLICRIRKP